MLGKILFTTGLYLVGKHVYGLVEITEAEREWSKKEIAFAFARKNVGNVIKSAKGSILYLLYGNGLRVEYENQQAYINDGSKEIMIIDDELLNNIGIITNAKIYESGFKWDKLIY
ncbi:hypothetical protein [Flavobacterium sp. AG291]|uniref:hypothetical protein n=1 Tax=Flavobacterium sp. AG291 TaxID=2184000 RepID=UPI000E09E760|nr:hypothetical protein [Flavobacterium sp. AG291]RDI07034.1 hypothetical protein DEU42_113134 [Flavobacterium sp. AG291]